MAAAIYPSPRPELFGSTSVCLRLFYGGQTGFVAAKVYLCLAKQSHAVAQETERNLLRVSARMRPLTLAISSTHAWSDPTFGLIGPSSRQVCYVLLTPTVDCNHVENKRRANEQKNAHAERACTRSDAIAPHTLRQWWISCC